MLNDFDGQHSFNSWKQVDQKICPFGCHSATSGLKNRLAFACER